MKLKVFRALQELKSGLSAIGKTDVIMEQERINELVAKYSESQADPAGNQTDRTADREGRID